MTKLSLWDVEREYVAWEQAARHQIYLRLADNGFLPIGAFLIDRWIEMGIDGTTTSLPDDYGIEYADTERLVHTPWACGFTKREAVIL